MKSFTLYELSSTYLHALETFSDPEADLPAEVMTDTLEALNGEWEDKAVNVVKFIRNLETTAQAIKQAEQAMAHRRKVLEQRAERMKTYVRENMTACGIQRIESPWFMVAVQKNPESVRVTDEGVIPDQYKTVVETQKVNKTQIKTALKSGMVVPGAELVSSTRLAIK